MNHTVVALHLPLDHEQRRRVQQEPEFRESVGHDDRVSRSGLVFQGEEADPLCRPRALPDDDESGRA